LHLFRVGIQFNKPLDETNPPSLKKTPITMFNFFIRINFSRRLSINSVVLAITPRKVPTR